VLVRAELDGRWTKWYNLGVWAGSLETIQRHSVRLQGDDDGYVAVDTLVISAKKATVNAYQLKVRLFSVDGVATPAVRYLSAAYSTAPTKKHEPSGGNPALGTRCSPFRNARRWSTPMAATCGAAPPRRP
jgi:hypothetical protein